MVPQFRKIQGRQLIELKKSYEFALKEAQSSLNTTAEERIETCHFKYVEGESLKSSAQNFALVSRKKYIPLNYILHQFYHHHDIS